MFRFARVLAFVLPGVLAAATGSLTQTFEFNQNDFVFDKVNGYDVVALPGAFSTTEPGKPRFWLAFNSMFLSFNRKEWTADQSIPHD